MAVSCFYRAVLFLLLWFRICSGQSTQPPTLTPTESPTSAPTEVPTQPSSSPTVSPSIRPTASPSEVPTIAPSSPTFPPTTLPTSTPSTQQPTNAGVQVLLDSSVIRLGESYYSVDATEKYTWDQVPQSCICQQTGATPSSCSYFQCTCACDVHAGICDYGCCCDPDCSADQKSRFQLLGCSPEGTGPETIQYCYPSDQLAKVNPRDPLGGQSAAQLGLGEALCVEKINYALEGQYFTDSPLKTSSVFSLASGQKTYDYLSSVNVVTRTPDAYYDASDPIEVFYESSTMPGELVVVGSGYLVLPAPDSGGICSYASYVGFEVSADSSCFRKIPSIETEFAAVCNTYLSTQQLVSSMRVAMHANTFEAMAGVSSLIRNDSVPVTLGTVFYRNVDTGIDYNITDQWVNGACATAMYSSNSAYIGSACRKAGLIYSGATRVCGGAVVGASYLFSHSSDSYSSITAVSVNLVVADIGIPNDAAYLKQTMSVSFYSRGASPSQSNGNQVTRRRSGNPGYIMGTHILFGQVDEAQGVVLERVDGMTTPSAVVSNSFFGDTRGGCPLDPAVTGFPLELSRGEMPIRFGVDVASGCSVPLNRSELIQLCCEGQTGCSASYTSTDSPYSLANGLPVFYNVSGGYIGIFGNADPLDTTQWLSVTPGSIAGFTRKWDEQLGMCSGMLSSLNYKFLVSQSGEQSNPQNKIIAAAVDYSTSDWTFSLHPNDLTSTQDFAFSVTVTFVMPGQQQTVEYYPPPPPVLFKVPYDVFYPFINAAHPGNQASVLYSILIIAFIFSVLIFQR